MRRTFATVALSNGVPIGQVGELLGHASTQTTKIYAKLLEETAHAAAAKTAGLMAGMLQGGETK
jgi:site-specific recombinase XerD